MCLASQRCFSENRRISSLSSDIYQVSDFRILQISTRPIFATVFFERHLSAHLSFPAKQNLKIVHLAR